MGIAKLEVFEKHAQEECPSCGNLFSCKVNNIYHCDCMQIKLTPAQSNHIKNYTELHFGRYECLCVNCLIELSKEISEK